MRENTMKETYAPEDISSEAFLTPDELAVRLRVKRSWIYSHADELGAYRCGKYLRFRFTRVLARLEGGVNSPTQQSVPNDTKSGG